MPPALLAGLTVAPPTLVVPEKAPYRLSATSVCAEAVAADTTRMKAEIRNLTGIDSPDEWGFAHLIHWIQTGTKGQHWKLSFS
jgi:hypothetical protein